jgi:transcriptional regulator with XRE-family HTH domain
MNDKVYVNAFTTHNTIIGILIKITRIHKGIKQNDFANLVGLSVSSVSKIERGEYSFGLEFVINACKVLNIPTGQLFTAYDIIVKFMTEQGIVFYNLSMPEAINLDRSKDSNDSDSSISMPMYGKLIQQYIKNSKTMNDAVSKYILDTEIKPN